MPGTEEHVYLDYNATAPVRPEVIARVSEVMARVGNASSVHGPGRAARQLVEAARAQVAALVGADPRDVVFTSGGTEANNLALKGSAERRLIVSAVEHGAVLAPALLTDASTEILPVDGDGVVRLDALQAILESADRPALVSVMLANNETGVIEPVPETARLAKAHGALVHCDAVQAAGKLPVDMAALQVDMLSLSAHKIGGPQGVGALVVAGDLPLESQQQGGGQELGRRSGTENVAGIVGFGVAAALAREGLERYAALAELRDAMERRLGEIAPARRVLSATAPRLPNTSCVTMPGVRADTQLMALDLAGIAVSAGSACSSGKVATSHVLDAMQIPEEEAASAIRISLGWRTTRADIDRFIAAWEQVYRRNGRRSDAA